MVAIGSDERQDSERREGNHQHRRLRGTGGMNHGIALAQPGGTVKDERHQGENGERVAERARDRRPPEGRGDAHGHGSCCNQQAGAQRGENAGKQYECSRRAQAVDTPDAGYKRGERQGSHHRRGTVANVPDNAAPGWNAPLQRQHEVVSGQNQREIDPPVTAA